MKNPGWIDLQVNGHNGVDFSNPNLTADMVVKAAEELFAAGPQIFLPTIITGPMELYRRNIPIIKKAIESHGYLDRVPGVHLEGPFIAKSHHGGMDPKIVRDNADLAELEEFLAEAAGTMRLMTLSPEVPHAVEAVRRLVAAGINCAPLR